MAHLVFSGLFDKHPDLKIITHHLGGMIPYFEGRVGTWVGSTRDAHVRRGLHAPSQETEEAAPRLLSSLLRRFRCFWIKGGDGLRPLVLWSGPRPLCFGFAI